MTTLDDLFKLIKYSEENRSTEREKDKEELAIERAKDKSERAEETAKLTNSISGLIKAGVREEVETAFKPVLESQNNLRDDNAALAEKVSFLQQELSTLKAASQPKPLTSLPPPIEPQAIHNRKDPNNDTEKKKAIINIVKKAKRTIGFSPITTEHIEQAKYDYDIDDDNEAKTAAVKDLLYFEMKISVDKIRSMKQARVFSSASIFDRIYVEFEEETSANYIYSLARNLKPEVKLHMHVPHSFYSRHQGIKDQEYPIRKGYGNVKTKIQFGYDDLYLSKRCSKESSWQVVELDFGVLPPVDLTPPPSQSSSPPPGRSRNSKSRKNSSGQF